MTPMRVPDADACRFIMPRGPNPGWSTEEKFQLLLNILKAAGLLSKIPWKEVELPEGRTEKACHHMIGSIKEDAGIVGPKRADAGSPRKKRAGDNGDASGYPAKAMGTTPAEDEGGESGAGKGKRKIGEVDGNDQEDAKPAPKKRGRPAGSGKNQGNSMVKPGIPANSSLPVKKKLEQEVKQEHSEDVEDEVTGEDEGVVTAENFVSEEDFD